MYMQEEVYCLEIIALVSLQAYGVKSLTLASQMLIKINILHFLYTFIFSSHQRRFIHGVTLGK